MRSTVFVSPENRSLPNEVVLSFIAEQVGVWGVFLFLLRGSAATLCRTLALVSPDGASSIKVQDV